MLVGLDWVFTHDAFKFCTSHVHAFMHTLYFFIPFLVCDVFYSLSLSLSLSLLDRRAMTPKVRKSTPVWNPLRGSESSSSNPPVPSHIWFRDEKAKTNFFENF